MYIRCLSVPEEWSPMTHELSQSVLNKIKELASDLNIQLGYALLSPVFVECRRETKTH